MGDGQVLRPGTITHCMETFIRRRRSEWESLPGFRPVRLVQKINNDWVPLEPTPDQIKKCLSTIRNEVFWITQQKDYHNDI